MIWISAKIFYTLGIKFVYFYGIDSIKTLNTNVESQNQHFYIFRSVFVHFRAFMLVGDPYYGGDLESWENFLHVRHPYYEFLWVSILRGVKGGVGAPWRGRGVGTSRCWCFFETIGLNLQFCLEKMKSPTFAHHMHIGTWLCSEISTVGWLVFYERQVEKKENNPTRIITEAMNLPLTLSL